MRSSASVFKVTGTSPVRAISARKMRIISGVDVPSRSVTLLAFTNKSFFTTMNAEHHRYAIRCLHARQPSFKTSS
jgi:hypothetical protein